jgi:hypothetical protein
MRVFINQQARGEPYMPGRYWGAINSPPICVAPTGERCGEEAVWRAARVLGRRQLLPNSSFHARQPMRPDMVFR